MVYEWKEAAQIKADAQKAGEMLEILEKTVGITPKNLVEANRDESAPLHNEFEWNDTKAAEKYRETQAGYIIRNICIVRESEEKPHRTATEKTGVAESGNGMALRRNDWHSNGKAT